MESTIIICLLTVVGNIIVSALSNRKITALVVYRIEQLEKKMELHNNAVMRLTTLEGKTDILDERIKVANNRIADLEHFNEKKQGA